MPLSARYLNRRKVGKVSAKEENKDMARGARKDTALKLRISRDLPRAEAPQGWQDQVRHVELRKETITLDEGRNISLRSCGGEGNPLIFLHGLLDSSASFSRLANSTKRPVVAIDLPGFGHSDVPQHTRLKDYADDVNETLEKLGIESCHVVGHSLGGAVASSLADRHGDKVSSLTLLTPAGFGTLHSADFFSLPILRSLGPTVVSQASGHHSLLALIYKATVVHHGHTDKELLTTLADSVRRGARGLNPALKTLQASGHSKGAFFKRRINYDGPVRAIFGSEDGLIPPSHIEGLQVGLPQSEVHLWADMGHHPQYEQACPTAAFINKTADDAENNSKRATGRN